ncbi:MAG: hypothetical protein GVY30_10300 [Chloroflexi bacterium]|nr:hypothetical protein [Chloroflexota bacterium]
MPDQETAPRTVDFFIAGNSKSGTSALYRFLKVHPQICMSYPKEPNVFATDFCHTSDVGAFKRRTLEQYHSFFSHAEDGQLWGESSACYLYSREAAHQIHQYNPDAQIVAIFREPVDFLYSYHLEMLTNPVSEGEVEKNFERALQLEGDRKAGRSLPRGCLVPELLHYSERVKYAEHLSRFYRYFDRDQVKVFIYEDFKQDNAAIYEELLRFLGVDPSFRPPAFETHNKSLKLKSKRAQQFVDNLSYGRGLFAPFKTAIKTLLPQSIRGWLIRTAYDYAVFKPKPTIDPDLERRLKAKFLSEVKAFGELIGEDMVHKWGYEAVSEAPR